MKKLSSYRTALLMSAVALSVLSSPANAVSEEVVRAYWLENSPEEFSLKPEVLDNLVKLNEGQWQKFKSTSQSFMPEGVNGYDRLQVIEALAEVASNQLFDKDILTTEKSLTSKIWTGVSRTFVWFGFGGAKPDKWDQFVAIARFLIKDMTGSHRAQVIRTLGKVAPEKWNKFKIIAIPLIFQDMTSENRLKVIETLENVAPADWDEFVSKVNDLTNGLNGECGARAIAALGKVAPEEWDIFVRFSSFLTKDMTGDNRIKVIETLENVAPENWAEFESIVKPLLRSSMHISRCDQPMQASKKMPSNSRGPSKTTWIRTLHHNMPEKDRAQVIEALGKVAPEQWNKFVSTVNGLTKDMTEEDHAKVIVGLVNVAPEQWDRFCTIVESLVVTSQKRNQFNITSRDLVAQDMIGEARANLIVGLTNVAPEKWDDFLTKVNNLTNGMTGDDRARVIAALAKVEPEKWAELLTIAGPLTQDLRAGFRPMVIVGLANVAPANWDDFLTKVNNLTQGMYSSERAQVIEALGGLDPQILFHPEFSKGTTVFININQEIHYTLEAIQMLGKHPDLFASETFSYYALFQRLGNQASLAWTYDVVKALSQIPEDKINNPKFLPAACSFMTKNMYPCTRAEVIEALGELAPEKLFHEKFVMTATSLIAKGISGSDRAEFIRDLGGMAPDIWDVYISKAESLLEADMKKYLRSDVVFALGKVAPEKWDEFVLKVNDLTNGMNGDDRARVIATLGRVAPAHWDKFIEIAKSLTEDMDGENRAKLITTLGQLKFEKWEKFQAIAVALTEDMDGETCAEVIYRLQNTKPEMLFHQKFVTIVRSLIKNKVKQDAAAIIGALYSLTPEKLFDENFVPAIEPLTRHMSGNCCAILIQFYSIYSAKSIKRAYSQIKRLMQETSDKIRPEGRDPAMNLITQLRECTSDMQAEVFINALIGRVNGKEGIVDRQALLTYIPEAWNEVKTLSEAELQARSKSRVSSAQRPLDSQATDILRPISTHTPTEEGVDARTPAGSSDQQEDEPARHRGLGAWSSAGEERNWEGRP